MQQNKNKKPHESHEYSTKYWIWKGQIPLSANWILIADGISNKINPGKKESLNLWFYQLLSVSLLTTVTLIYFIKRETIVDSF